MSECNCPDAEKYYSQTCPRHSVKSTVWYEAQLTAKDEQIAELRAFSVKAGSWTLGELYDASAKDAQLKARCEELEKPRASITDTPFTVENITIDQRYKFEQEIKKLTEEINFLKEARSKSAKLVCEDCGCALARF